MVLKYILTSRKKNCLYKKNFGKKVSTKEKCLKQVFTSSLLFTSEHLFPSKNFYSEKYDRKIIP